MRTTSKVLSIILLCSILLVSCGGVTPTSEPTATALPTQTLQVTATSPSILSLPFSLTGPDRDSTRYKLKISSDDWYLAQLEQISTSMMAGEIEISQIPPTYYAKLISTFIIRQNEFSPNNEILWRLVRNDPNSTILPASTQQKDLLAFLVAGLLNQNSVSQSNLADALSLKDIWIDGNVVLKNGGENGIDVEFVILHIGGDNPGNQAIYAIWREENIYKVERVNEWISSLAGGGIYYSLHDAGDVNQNGIHELAVEIESGHSGIPVYEDKVLALYEWSSVFKRFEYIQGIPVFAQSSDEGPLEGGWSFTENGILITKENWYTGENCPQIAVEREYRWDGTKYIEMSTQIVPSAPKQPVFCRLSWAAVVVNKTHLSWHNDEAIAVFDEFVRDWPDEFSQTMGPAILDYYKFKLGLWHDMRGEEKQALEIIGDLAQAPTHPDFDLFSRMASLHLEERKIHGFAKACLVADSAYNDELTKLFPGNEDREDSVLLDKLGFVTTDLAGWNGQLCDDTDALPAAIGLDDPHDVDLVPDWLSKNGFTWYQKFKVDLNDDGFSDLLVSMDTYEDNDPGIWIFFQKPNSVAVLLPDRFGPYESLSVSDYTTSDFQMTLSNPNWSFVYFWDEKFQHFREVDFFHDKQNKLETMIYRERDYENAIRDITEFFKQDIENLEVVKNCAAYCPEWYFPYFQYLLGFSYEMLGDTEKAKSAYYSLWHDYPTNVFGVAASLKLEKVSP